MLGNITDAKAKRKAEMLANAAIAGAKIKKIKVGGSSDFSLKPSLL